MYKKFPLTAVALSCLLVGCGGEDEGSGGVTNNTNSSTTVLSIDSSVTVNEPVSGKTIKIFDVSFSGQASKKGSYTITVDSSIAIEGADFFVPNTTIEFAKGDTKSSFDIEIISDGVYEGEENFVISLSIADGAEIHSTRNKTEITLRDADSAPVVEFSSIISSASENTLGYELELILSSLSEKEISIPFTLSGIAIEDFDYTLLGEKGVVTFLAKNGVTYIPLNIVGDTIQEGGESLTFTLGQPSIGSLGDKDKHTIQILGELGLNDTGSNTFYDGQSFTASSGNNEFPGQDAEFGADSLSPSDTDGNSGHSFTKIDRAGNAMSYTDSDQYCVRDERTGLVWEVKQVTQPLPASGNSDIVRPIIESWERESEEGASQLYASSFANFQAQNYRYYYFNADKKSNNGQEGVDFSSNLGFSDKRYPINNLAAFPNTKSTGYSSSNRMANSDVYISYLNETSMCGHNDWRLPTIKELRSRHNYGAGDDLDTYNFFPHSQGSVHMSDTQSANSSGVIWCLESDTGKAKHCLKNTPTQIRAVRGLKL